LEASNTPIRVAVAGMRGIPAKFGGSETATEEIGRRLAEQGFEFTVYCRRHNSTTSATEYRGMRRVVLPSMSFSQSFDTLSHSFLASLHILTRNTADVVHFTGMGNALMLPLFRLSKKKVVITIDGPDWERPKWGRIARAMLKLSARLATRWADELIIDNHPSIAYFREHFGAEGTYIPYGADRNRPEGSAEVSALGLEPGQYLLFVAALVLDKGPDVLLDAYALVSGELPLVLVGDSPFALDYRRRLADAAAADSRVRMVGYVFGDAYRELVANCRVYVHPLRSDGTSPALLQAMGFGCCIVVNSVEETLSAVGDAALAYELNDAASLAGAIEQVLGDVELEHALRARALKRAVEEYDWDAVSTAHGALYARLADQDWTPAP
jgi:glycosyltransferase involved in cell wall biosynthesis